MDLKRNYSSNIQPPTQIKANHLVNPLVGIEKASTPVRTRIIKPGAPLNSTPVNVHKIGAPAKSPSILNKQNDAGNSKFGLRKPKATEQNINLSPIMALNRKMSEGQQQFQYRSLTPTGMRRQQSLSNIMDKKDSVKNEQGGQNLQDSRTSNSFRNMLESRSKTPTRIAFAEVCQKQPTQIGNGLRTSGSAQALLQGINSNKLKDSRTCKLGESRSFEQLINIGTPVNRDDQILCSNSSEHEKKVKAKYKVMEEPEDEQLLVYCSKCAINLVHKGFKVEDLTAEDIRRIKSYQHNSTNLYHASNEYYDYANQTGRKLQIKLSELRQQKDHFILAYQKQLDDVDCYYNSLVSLIEQQKTRDKQTILRNKEKQKISGDTLEKKLIDASANLNHMLKSGRVGAQQFRNVQQIQSLLTQKGFTYRFDGSKCLMDKIQQRFNHFSQVFQSEGRLRIQSEEREDRYSNPSHGFQQITDQRQKADCPLRFSFQKNMKEVRKSPLNFRGGVMNPLEEANESMEGEDSGEMASNHDKKAFRTLFPDEEEDDRGEKQTGLYSPTFKQI